MAELDVRVDGISKRFQHRVKGEVYAVRDVQLHAQPGEFLTLLGPSGCGKTTTLRTVAGFEQPDSGRIWFGERDMTQVPANQRNLGFVFQNYALFPHLSVADNVAYGLQVRGVPAAQIRQQVAEVLALVGLAGYEHQFSSQLSGGEQQRVALARAIVIKPQVLLFDEPLSNLDAKLRVQMRSEIRALQRRLNITTLYVTHDQEEAMAVSDRIVVMNQGRVVQQGRAEDLYHRPATGFVARFIGRINTLQPALLQAGGREAPAGLDVMLRPESLQVMAVPPADGRVAVAAQLLSRTFLGEKVELLLQCAGQTLLAIAPGGGPAVAEGATVTVAFAAGDLLQLPADGDEGSER